MRNCWFFYIPGKYYVTEIVSAAPITKKKSFEQRKLPPVKILRIKFWSQQLLQAVRKTLLNTEFLTENCIFSKKKNFLVF